MGKINVEIYGRDYSLACDDGQEAHLGQLVQMLNDRLRKLSTQMGRGPESTMLVFTALMIADELQETRDELKQIRKELNSFETGKGAQIQQQRLSDMENAMAQSMQHIAERIESLSTQLEAA